MTEHDQQLIKLFKASLTKKLQEREPEIKVHTSFNPMSGETLFTIVSQKENPDRYAVGRDPEYGKWYFVRIF